ncbi:MAG: Stp1/IreP family PP2C-type Ser/Thr phosphatase [Agathobacter sp.]|nr:Stp1/IreP family PP2C-type Ser/Thr phosphatase [Agathobacter sp.]
MKTFSITDTGIIRETNQDYLFASEKSVGNLPNLFIVADGMGGHRAGDYASRHTVERIVASITRTKEEKPISILKEAIDKANELLVAESKRDETKSGMGTTLVIASIFDNTMYVANVGDSRLYICGQSIRQITRDHSLVNEMILMGEISEEEAKNHPDKNVITRAIGVKEHVEADYFEVELTNDELVLLCTDGLTNMVSDEEIQKILVNDEILENKAEKLIKRANKNGGSDNITVMIINPFS